MVMYLEKGGGKFMHGDRQINPFIGIFLWKLFWFFFFFLSYLFLYSTLEYALESLLTHWVLGYGLVVIDRYIE